MGTSGSGRVPVAWPDAICTPIDGANVPKRSEPQRREAMGTRPEPMRDQLVIRVRFRNGTVREMRGSETDCEALFDHDTYPPLIDYVQALDPKVQEFAMYFHTDDDRWADFASGDDRTEPPRLSA